MFPFRLVKVHRYYDKRDNFLKNALVDFVTLWSEFVFVLFFFNYEFSEVWILYYNSLISNNLNIKIAYNAHPMFTITWGLQSVHRAASLQNIDSFQNKHVLHVLKVPSIFLVFSVTGLNFDIMINLVLKMSFPKI